VKKIYNKNLIVEMRYYPVKVVGCVAKRIEILDLNYGNLRSSNDLGGYVLVLVNIREVIEIKNTIIQEYTGIIECEGGKHYCLSLFLLSSDYSCRFI
jgi:hypothetical protein